jgi:hypothetical protein
MTGSACLFSVDLADRDTRLTAVRQDMVADGELADAGDADDRRARNDIGRNTSKFETIKRRIILSIVAIFSISALASMHWSQESEYAAVAPKSTFGIASKKKQTISGFGGLKSSCMATY